FAVPREVNASARIFDVQGRLVRTMHEGPLDHGVHRLEWNGAENSGQRSAAGVYFLKVNAAEFSTVRKLVLLEKRSH
ncbi:MAG TPA: FlgD immunoglobulin-like domain containing protein, partial [bacterium]|nr:FlgD immunoglobulin-like domain containing protein [bacterium]